MPPGSLQSETDQLQLASWLQVNCNLTAITLSGNTVHSARAGAALVAGFVRCVGLLTVKLDGVLLLSKKIGIGIKNKVVIQRILKNTLLF